MPKRLPCAHTKQGNMTSHWVSLVVFLHFQSKNVFLVSMFQHSCINKATCKCKFSPNSFYVNLALKHFMLVKCFEIRVRVQEVPVVSVNAFVESH